MTASASPSPEPPRAAVSLEPVPDREFLAAWRAAPAALRVDRVCDWLIAHVRAFLRLDAHERVGPDTRFLELGFDSLLAVDFKLLLERKLDCELRSTVVFDCPTPAELCSVLDRELARDAHERDPVRESAHDSPHESARAADARGARAEAAHARTSDGDEHAARVDALARATANGASASHASALAAASEPIAIVGMACRFPGGGVDPDSYWRFLLSGRDAITEIPSTRWDLASWYDADRASPGKMYVRHGGFLDDIERFDAAFFGITPREAQELDPQQRLLLETAWEALERAGIAPDSLGGQPVAFYLGTRGSDYFVRCSPFQREVIGTYNASGNALSTAAGRVSYTLGFTGPCFALDTACSSSLVALHEAVAALHAGECTLALAAGVNLVLDPIGTVSTCKAGMLSPGGRCRAFSSNADGYVRSEGVGLLVLEPLSAALRARRRPLALVRGSAINQDGASGGLTVPSGAAQVEVMRLALRRGGVDPASVAHVEAHGTGTSLGDPIEVRALHEVYGAPRGRTRKLTIGSVKTNIGHCETAAGMAGVIKAVQALRHGELPAILHCATKSPHIDWNASAVEPVLERRAFEREDGAPRRVGVSSFGFSGTNGHVVLEEAPSTRDEPASARSSELVLLSAATPSALAESARRLRAQLESRAELELADVAYTLGVGRASLRERFATRVRDVAQLREQLGALSDEAAGAARGRGTAGARAPRVAFLYTGQGAQRAGMGRELHEHCRVFRDALEQCSAALAPHVGCAIEELLFGARSAELSRTEWTQPALFALEHALTRTWGALGVAPCWVLGHSVGEYAAAVAADVLTLEQAAELVSARGRLMRELAPEGAMVAVHASHERVAQLVATRALAVDLAADNAPDLCTWSGEHAAIAELERVLAGAGMRAQRLDVSHAFHSRLLEPMLAPFEARVRALAPRIARIGFISNVSGAPAGEELRDARRWSEHARRPVRFADGVRALLAQDVDCIVEIGPAPVLAGLLRRCAPESRVPIVASLRAGGGEWDALQDAVAELWSRGARIDAAQLHAGRTPRCIELPTYPFERERHWIEIPSGDPSAFTARASDGVLGVERSSSLLASGDALYEARFSATRPAWIGGHRVYGRVLAPAALYVVQALEAGARALGTRALRIERLAIEQPLELGAVAVEVHAQRDDDGASVRIASRAEEPEAPWRTHARARCTKLVELEQAARTLDDAIDACREPVDVAAHFAEFERLGLEYDGPFRALEQAWSGPAQSLSRIRVDGAGARFVHVAALDQCFQACRALMPDAARGHTYLPVAIERCEWASSVDGVLWAHARRVEPDGVESDTHAADTRAATERDAPDRDAHAASSQAPESSNPSSRAAAAAVAASHAHGASAQHPPRRVVVSIDVYADDRRLVGRITGLQLVRADARLLRPERSRTARLLYEVGWTPLARLDARARVDGTWIVVAPPSELRARCADELEQAGAHVRSVDPRARDAALEIRAAVEHATSASMPCSLVYVCAEQASVRAHEDDVAARTRAELARAVHVFQAFALAQPPTGARARLVTRGAHGVVPTPLALDVAGAALGGWFAAIAREQPSWRALHVDLDPLATSDDARACVAEFAHAALASDAAHESRIALRFGERYGARLHEARARRRLDVPAADSFALRCDGSGVLDGLLLLAQARRAPRAGEVELEIDACGLNFKDVLYALGRLDEFARSKGIDDPRAWPLGMEACARVVSVGPDVTDLEIGTRVWCIGTGLCARHAIVLREQVAAAPRTLRASVAAAQPVAWLTTLWALERLAGLRAGETLLVHGAAGGVGHAALRYARSVGARVIATASRAKHAYVRELGADVVVDSRAADLAAELRAAAGEHGVDVVLSGLGGDAVEAGLALLRARGRYVELGKLGVWSAERVAAARADVAYHVFDLELELAREKTWMRDALERLAREFDAGALAPVETSALDVRRARDGIDALARRRAVGKLALEFSVDDATPRADRTYAITGGLGGIGLAIAEAWIDTGARWLLLIARSAPSDAAEARLAAWRARGVRVETRRADVADRVALERALELPAEWPRIERVLHAAGALHDATLASLRADALDDVLAPKLAGALALRASAAAHDARLCFASSIAGVLGSAGQSIYAAANAALDALALEDAARGRGACAIAYGPWAEVGMAARLNARQRERLGGLGLRALSNAAALAATNEVLDSGSPAALVVDVDWAAWSANATTRDAFLGALVETGAKSGARSSGGATRGASARGAARRALAASASEPQAARLSAWLATEIAAVTGLGSAERIDAQRRFVEYGIDSLQSVELRNRIEHGLDASLPTTLLFDHPTLAALTAHLAAQLAPGVTHGADSSAAPSEPVAADSAADAPDAELLAEIERLSEDEARGLLAAESADG